MLTVLQYEVMEAFGGYDTSLIVANVNAVEFELIPRR
jgi:hypothetical protein